MDLLKFESQSEVSVIAVMMDKVWVLKQRAILRMLTVDRKRAGDKKRENIVRKGK